MTDRLTINQQREIMGVRSVRAVQHLPRIAWQQGAYRIVQVRAATEDAAAHGPYDPYILETTDGTDAMGTVRWTAVRPDVATKDYLRDVLCELVRVLGGGEP